ncbi:hypothetical protein MJN39_24865, partial [Salmonella enterica subsp. enterica serovar Kentucky]|nr:hypothetical protein [Salmonella enterica subsp. enterica serovar Kentucky]
TPVDEAWDGPAALDGKRIATSYPHLLKRYLDQKGVSFKSCLLSGAVEIGFLDRFTGAVVLTGDVSAVEYALKQVTRTLGEMMQF